MLCPKCGTEVGNVVRYCKSCVQHNKERESKQKEKKALEAITPDSEPISLTETAEPNAEGFKEIFSTDIPAGFWLRFFAFLIDFVILGIINFFCIELLLLKVFDFNINNLILDVTDLVNRQILEIGFIWILIITSIISLIIKCIFYSISIFVVGLLYYSLFESSKYKATIGKLLLGIYVCNYKCEQQRFDEALIRNACKFFSNITFGIGYLIIIFTKYKQSLHDLISTSYVVKKKKYSYKKRNYFAALGVLLFVVWIYSYNKISLNNNSSANLAVLQKIPKPTKITGSGLINGKFFKPNSAFISKNGILTFREGEDFFAKRKISIFLFDEFKSLSKRTFKVKNDKNFGNPHIHISEMKEKSKIPETEIISNNYLLILKFNKIKNNTISGTIELNAGGKKPASLNLSFNAYLR